MVKCNQRRIEWKIKYNSDREIVVESTLGAGYSEDNADGETVCNVEKKKL